MQDFRPEIDIRNVVVRYNYGTYAKKTTLNGTVTIIAGTSPHAAIVLPHSGSIIRKEAI